MIILIDFDGTCVTHEFPKIGKDIGAVPILKRIVDNGHRLVLFTMRSNMTHIITNDDQIYAKPDDYLTQAINWFKYNDIELYGINETPNQKDWTSSPKAYGDMYIDDLALGVPLIYNKYYCDKPYVDWEEIEKILITKNII